MTAALPIGRAGDPSQRRVRVLTLRGSTGRRVDAPGERLRLAVAAHVDRPSAGRPGRAARRAARPAPTGSYSRPSARSTRGRRAWSAPAARARARRAPRRAWRGASSPSGPCGGRRRRRATPWAAQPTRRRAGRSARRRRRPGASTASCVEILANRRWAAMLDGQHRRGEARRRPRSHRRAGEPAAQRRADAPALQVVGDDDRDLGGQRRPRASRTQRPTPTTTCGLPRQHGHQRVVVDEVDLGQVPQLRRTSAAAWERGSAGRPSAPTGVPGRRRARPCRPAGSAGSSSSGSWAQGRSVMQRTALRPCARGSVT